MLSENSYSDSSKNIYIRVVSLFPAFHSFSCIFCKLFDVFVYVLGQLKLAELLATGEQIHFFSHIFTTKYVNKNSTEATPLALLPIHNILPSKPCLCIHCCYF